MAAAIFAVGLAAGALFHPASAPKPATVGAAKAAAATTGSPPAAGRATAAYGHPAQLVRVLDGDTFEVRVHVWPGIDITTKVRLRGIDAPELRARCPDERRKAEAARDALVAMLNEGEITVSRIGLDKYGGRVLADAATRAVPDISGAMLATGLARPYGGGKRQTWCEGPVTSGQRVTTTVVPTLTRP
ncbi:MAG TPA: thermonuclease family protein [Xanthobacteraceae bacterium]|jgi:endonuclease YncB( thermonuclease family)